MRILTNCVLVVLLSCPMAFPEALIHPAPGERPRMGSFWKASVISLLTSSAMDIQSSLGRRELNPMLADSQGRFSGRGIAIKALITGGAVGAQWLMLRRHPESQKYAAIANLGMTGLFTSAVIHNHTNQKKTISTPVPATPLKAAFEQRFVPATF